MSALPTEAFDLSDRHSLNAFLRQGFFDVMDLEGFNDRFNFFHRSLLKSGHSRIVQELYHRRAAKIPNKLPPFSAQAAPPAQKNGRKRYFCLNSVHLLPGVQQMLQR